MSCEKCSDWKSCPGYESYQPADIKFCPHQVKWLLENYEEIEKGNWPSDGLVSYGDRRGSGSSPHTIPVENAVTVWQRVQSIQPFSEDAELTINVLTMKWDIVSLSRLMKVSPQRLQDRIDRVLRYCSGRNTKRKNYKEWCQHRQFRVKK